MLSRCTCRARLTRSRLSARRSPPYAARPRHETRSPLGATPRDTDRGVRQFAFVAFELGLAGPLRRHTSLLPAWPHLPMSRISHPRRGTTLTTSNTRSRRCPILHHQLGSCGGSCLVSIMGINPPALKQRRPTPPVPPFLKTPPDPGRTVQPPKTFRAFRRTGHGPPPPVVALSRSTTARTAPPARAGHAASHPRQAGHRQRSPPHA